MKFLSQLLTLMYLISHSNSTSQSKLKLGTHVVKPVNHDFDGHLKMMNKQVLDEASQAKLKALREFSEMRAKMLIAQQARNITVTKERIGAAASRWDDNGGSVLDSEIKGDGPQQLQFAMMALALVAGTIICGGGIVVACCWQNREKGHLKKSGKYHQVDGSGSSNPYQGQGAKWLQTPV